MMMSTLKASKKITFALRLGGTWLPFALIVTKYFSELCPCYVDKFLDDFFVFNFQFFIYTFLQLDV